ncbi:MAG: hypothetical protein U1F77_18710 [Kiritimatiellia bacterium]
MSTRHPIAISALAALILGASPALHAGNLGTPPAHPFTTGTVEVYRERFRTDIEQEFRQSGGQTFLGEQKEDRWVGRSTFRLGDRWLAHALAGGSDSEGSDGSAPMGGVGAEWTAWTDGPAALSLLASTEYVHEITYRRAAGRWRHGRGRRAARGKPQDCTPGRARVRALRPGPGMVGHPARRSTSTRSPRTPANRFEFPTPAEAAGTRAWTSSRTA